MHNSATFLLSALLFIAVEAQSQTYDEDTVFDTWPCNNPPTDMIDCDSGTWCVVAVCNDSSLCEQSLRCAHQSCKFASCGDISGILQCTYVDKYCDDSNFCTDDTCVDDECVHTPHNCDDYNVCTDDLCFDGGENGGWCYPSYVTCEDSDPCTVDQCLTDGCHNDPLDCSEFVYCDGGTVATCVAGNCECASPSSSSVDPNACTTLLDCDDDDLCTRDACVEYECKHNALCDDYDPCTNDTCAGGQCTQILNVCSDGDPCTMDRCSTITGECTNTPLRCRDLVQCAGCSIAQCIQGACVCTAIHCDDNNSCTSDSCIATSDMDDMCLYTQINCDDGNACTVDSCSPTLGCTYEALSCDDGLLCTVDSCLVAFGCTQHPKICDDYIDCTADSCTNATGICFFNPSGCSILCRSDPASCQKNIAAVAVSGALVGAFSIATCISLFAFCRKRRSSYRPYVRQRN